VGGVSTAAGSRGADPALPGEDAARSAANTAGRGRLGVFGAETLVWLAPPWFHILRIASTYRSGTLKKVDQVWRCWNMARGHRPI